MSSTLLFCFLAALPTPDAMRRMPGVFEVTVRAAENPTHRITHILNYHWVPEDQFRIEFPDGDYPEFLAAVDSVQREQVRFLKALGARQVYYEGLTEENRQAFARMAEILKQVPPPAGDSPVDRLLNELRQEDLLQLGAPGRMQMAGDLDAVLPADDAELLEAANPVRSGKIVFDEEANDRRERAVVKLLLKERESVLVMGGGHDLTDKLPEGVEYVRVTLEKYRTASNAIR